MKLKFMEADMKNIWKMEGGKKKTWWWWFWLFFIDNPKNPDKPLQVMILWSRKREKHILCNDVELNMDHEILEKVHSKEFHGATACWYFDGNEMHEDFLVKPSQIALYGDGKLLETKSEFTQEKNGKFRVKINGKQGTFDLTLGMLPNYPPIHKDHNFAGGLLGYNIFKINRLSLQGTFKSRGKTQSVTGTSYFQKVYVTGPVIPWQWGLVHFKNGSYLSYNIGRIGQSLFAERHSPLDVKLRRKLEFFDAKTKKLYYFRSVKINRSKGNLPTFTLQCKSNEATLEVSLDSYSRALWRLQKSKMHSLNTLYYHEFCVSARHFVLNTKTEQITLKDLGKGYGNCEDSKGFMI